MGNLLELLLDIVIQPADNHVNSMALLDTVRALVVQWALVSEQPVSITLPQRDELLEK